MSMENNSQGFGSKIGLLAATIGSAVGLGTIWRFPAVVQSQGGSAFLLVYFFCLLLFGIPVMLGEFSLGRAGGANVIGIFKHLTPKTRWWLVGLCGLLASYLILPFYMVVAGWGLEYLWLSLSGSIFEGIDFSASSSDNCRIFSERMQQIMNSPTEPVLWTYGMILLNLFILIKGVQKGIEKMSKVLMPVLFLLLVVFCVVSLSLPGAKEGVEFFLKPDFSKVTPQMVVYALGQALFSLSLGMGV
ncbi:MAG: sodium-dependent transporter, partial [Bacteroidaceae bacterium]|nr:sodium-dependent transporter [Bacteroidaceae bacterium]